MENLFNYHKDGIAKCFITLFRMDIFGTVHRGRGEGKNAPLPKICHTYRTMMWTWHHYTLIHLVIIWLISEKMSTPGLLKITALWNKCYDVIIHVDDVTNKILLRDSNHIKDDFMWPKFGNSNISMRDVITTSIL